MLVMPNMAQLWLSPGLPLPKDFYQSDKVDMILFLSLQHWYFMKARKHTLSRQPLPYGTSLPPEDQQVSSQKSP